MHEVYMVALLREINNNISRGVEKGRKKGNMK